MHGLSRSEVRVRLPLVLVARLPDALRHIFIGHLVKNSVACKYNKIMVLVNLELSYFWFCLYHIHVPSSICQLSFRITKGTRYGQSAGQNSYWPNHILRLRPLDTLRVSIITTKLFWGLILTLSFKCRRIWLQGLSCCRLVNLSAILNDSSILVCVRGLMIPTKWHNNLSAINWNGSTTVSDVGTVANIANNKDHNSTTAWPVNDNCVSILISSLAHLNKCLFSFPESSNNCLPWILRKAVLLDHKVVQLVSEELRAVVTAVTIVHSEEAAFGPDFFFAMGWLGDV